ncbi:hypothetical protein MCEMIE11_00663 [Burkholderiales bacterium]
MAIHIFIDYQNHSKTNPRSISTPQNTPFLRGVPSLAQVNRF